MVVLIIAAAGAWTLSRTAFGRDFYAVGITSPPRVSWA
jgi:AI-2 transport system permease protein